MPKKSGNERRHFIRAKRVLSIQYRLSSTTKRSTTKKWNLSVTQNMSVGGLLFYSDKEYKEGDILDIHVIMSGVLDIFKGKAKIVRNEKKKTGANFLIAVKYIDKKLSSRKLKTYTTKKRSAKRV